MPVICFLLPVCVIYISEIICALIRRDPRDTLKALLRKPSLIIASLLNIIFTVLVLTVVFMDFKAVLGFNALKLLTAVATSLCFALIRKLLSHLKRSGSYLTAVLTALAAALFLEVFIFNFRFFQTYYYESEDVTSRLEASYSLILNDGTDNVYTLTGAPSSYFELTDINREVKDVYLDITAHDEYGNVVTVYVTTYMTDESNELYTQLPAHTVTSEVESTKYLYLLTNGSSEKLKFNISSVYGDTITLNRALINAPRSFDFSFIRLAVVALLICLIWLLRPSSKIYGIAFNQSSTKQQICTAAILLLEIILLIVLSVLNPAFSGNPARHTAQYQQLAEAFLQGHLYLAEEPAPFLAEMENPYDYNLRTQAAAKAGQTYYWDAAYYNGHYYVYFGVLPVLLLYLPFRAITGQNLPNRVAIQVFLCLFAVASFLLIEKIISKFFRQKRIPYVSYIILTLIFINATGAVFIAKRPDFYSIPIISSLAFTVFGIYMWLCSTDIPGRIKVLPAVGGSLCMALVAACRPQFLFASLLVFPIFWNSVFKERLLFSKKGFWKTAAMCIPYILVAAGVMWYNNARFGSPFDFGANYNLTTNDMTGRGFNVERCGLALFTYFFQPPNLSATFPFLFSTSIKTNYLGVTITEPMFGGIFATIPLLWLVFLIPAVRKYFKDKRLIWISGICIFLGLFIGVFDAQGAGLLQRYVSDFAYLPCLAAIIVFLVLCERSRGSRRKQLNAFLCFAFFSSAVYCFLIVFANYSVELCYKNPTLYSQVSELVQFWS